MPVQFVMSWAIPSMPDSWILRRAASEKFFWPRRGHPAGGQEPRRSRLRGARRGR